MKKRHKRVNIKCPYCGSRAILRPETFVRGKKSKPGRKLYVCARYPACDSYVGASPHSNAPLGTLANASLRCKRREAHAAFDCLWKSGLMTRKAAYRWLQTQMGLPRKETHIAKFFEWRCNQVIQLCSKFAVRQSIGRRHAPKDRPSRPLPSEITEL